MRASTPAFASLFVATLALTGGAVGQVPVAASNTHALTASAAATGTTHATSFSYGAELVLGLPWVELVTKSPSYGFTGSVLGSRGPLADLPPLLCGVVGPAAGMAVGNFEAPFFGVNFDQAAVGSLSASFAGSPVNALQYSEPNVIKIKAPSGFNAHGNPLGAVDVALQSDLGVSARSSAYHYMPALVLDDRPHDGGVLAVRFRGQPGSTMFLAIGQTQPGAAQSLPAFEGALELVLNPVFLLLFVPTTQGELAMLAPLDGFTALIGLTFELQALQATSLNPNAGSWTNVLAVTIEA